MNILFIHSFHRDGSSSGDDIVVNNEIELLRKKGHTVDVFSRFNSEVDKATPLKKISLLSQIPWSVENYLSLNRVLKNKKYEVAHIHTWFPLMSPAIYEVLYKNNVPIVQTLHDFRFFCPVAFLYRNDEICEECNKKGLHSAVINRCFQNSYIKSSLAVATLETVKIRKVFNKISLFIAFTQFDKEKFIELGIPANKIVIKPHFLPARPEIKVVDSSKEKYFLYLGRLSKEKGVDFLLNTWKNTDIKLKIIGSGDLENMVKDYSVNYNNIEYLGFVNHSDIYRYIKDAVSVIMPSVWYETFGMVIMEAYSVGTPVIATNLGAMVDMVIEGETGFKFKRKDKQDLLDKVIAISKDNRLRTKMSKNALLKFKKDFTPEKNYKQLIEIYDKISS